jgi:hypothetical protein
MLVMVCFFPTAKFQSSLVSMFFFFSHHHMHLFVHDVLQDETFRLIDVEMLPNGV